MSMIDRDAGQPCQVIPFERPAGRKEELTISSIAAVVAVTVLHYENESPETRLLEIIESSGEVEVLDVLDTLKEFYEARQNDHVKNDAVNDNGPVAIL